MASAWELTQPLNGDPGKRATRAAASHRVANSHGDDLCGLIFRGVHCSYGAQEGVLKCDEAAGRLTFERVRVLICAQFSH
jgi:hypothetical protein